LSELLLVTESDTMGVLPHDAAQSAVLLWLSVRLSVCLSLTFVDCDHTGWNSSKIISRLVSLGCLHSTELANPNIMGTSWNFGRNRGGIWKSGFRRRKAL